MHRCCLQVFPDVGNNAVVISLQDGPVVDGDVKVMFESSAVSTSILFTPFLKKHLEGSLTFSLTGLSFTSRVFLKATKMFLSTSGSTPPSQRGTSRFLQLNDHLSDVLESDVSVSDSELSPNCPQAVSTPGRAGQPTQTQDLGPVQGRLWCHHVLLRTLIKRYEGEKQLVTFNDG